MDIWQLIEHDHAYLAHLIQELRYVSGAAPAIDRGEVLSDLIDELAAHAEALEASLYAPLRQLDRTRELAEDLHHEHAQFMRQLDDLARYQRIGPSRRSSTDLNVALIGQHLRRYIQELIPAARELLSPAQVDAAAHAFIRAKMRALRARHQNRSGSRKTGEVMLACLAAVVAAGLSYVAGRLKPSRDTSGSGQNTQQVRRAEDERRST